MLFRFWMSSMSPGRIPLSNAINSISHFRNSSLKYFILPLYHLCLSPSPVFLGFFFLILHSLLSVFPPPPPLEYYSPGSGTVLFPHFLKLCCKTTSILWVYYLFQVLIRFFFKKNNCFPSKTNPVASYYFFSVCHIYCREILSIQINMTKTKSTYII